jgi:very-short-patch-repair endonuclease
MPTTEILLNRAKNLRQNQSDAEQLMWQKLRSRRFLGLKFRRQVVIQKYILDFFCDALNLGVELDGGHHQGQTQLNYDLNRSQFLAAHQIEIVRFWNNDVLKDINSVLTRLIDIVNERKTIIEFPLISQE